MTTLWPSARYGSPYDHLVILRCTKKLLAIIGLALTAEPAPAPDPEDWYANLLWFDRRKCLLLTHSVTLFSIFEPDVRPSGLRATRHLVTRLIDRTSPRETAIQHIHRPVVGGGPERMWAVEGAAGLGHLLAQQLLAAGEQVVDVQPKLGARVRLLAAGAVDKNDPNDARSVAIAALRSPSRREVRPDDHAAVLRCGPNATGTWAAPRSPADCTLCCAS